MACVKHKTDGIYRASCKDALKEIMTAQNWQGFDYFVQFVYFLTNVWPTNIQVAYSQILLYLTDKKGGVGICVTGS